MIMLIIVHIMIMNVNIKPIRAYYYVYDCAYYEY